MRNSILDSIKTKNLAFSFLLRQEYLVLVDITYNLGGVRGAILYNKGPSILWIWSGKF